MSDTPPIACDATAIDEDEREAHGRVGRQLLAQVAGYRELADGYALRLPTETDAVQRAGTFVSRERLCCPFLDFELEVTAEQGPVWLRLTGPDGTKTYLERHMVPHIEGA